MHLRDILEIIVVIFCGKFYRFNAFLRYGFQRNTAVQNDPPGYNLYHIDAASDYLHYIEYL